MVTHSFPVSTHLISILLIFSSKNVKRGHKFELRGRPFNSCGGAWVILKKKIPASSCRKKKLRAAECNRKLQEPITGLLKAYGKKGKKYPAHQIAIKKILDDQKSPTPPLKS